MLKFVIVSLSVLFLFIAGCGGSRSASEPNEMVIYQALYASVKGLDPGDMRDLYSSMVASQVFEQLYQYHFLKRPYEIIPLLADGMPQVSDDMLTYTIKIKKGVYFQDDKCFPNGKARELKAEDFIYAIKRIANIKYLSPNWSMFDNKIVGLDEFREYTKSCKKMQDIDFSKDVEGLQKPDDYTLVIKLKKPWPQMIATAFADISTSPIAKEAVDFYGKDIRSHPVGTGPYRLGVWNRGSYVELVRNPKFRGELYPSEGEPGDKEAGYLDDAGKMMPFADKIVWMFIEEYQPGWFLFLQGKTDASVIPKDNFDEAMAQSGELTPAMKQRNIYLEIYDVPSTFFIGFNMLDPVLSKNKPLRKAISLAIDRQKFVDLFFNGRDKIAYGFVPVIMDSYDPNIKDKGYGRYDPDGSRRLLAEAEKIYGGKLPVFKIAIPGTDTFSRQYGQFFERQLKEVGLQIELDFMDWPTYQDKLNTRSLQMFMSGWHGSIPDAQDFLQSFYSKYWAPGANHFNYINPEFDKLYEKVEVMQDSPERRKLYRQMELMVLEDCPAAFINHQVGYALLHDWYKNYKPHAFALGLSKYRRVDVAERAAYKELLKKIK